MPITKNKNERACLSERKRAKGSGDITLNNDDIDAMRFFFVSDEEEKEEFRLNRSSITKPSNYFWVRLL